MRATINPIASSKQPFELKGEHAKIQSHVPRPTIYIDIDEGPQSGTALADRFRLVRTEIKKRQTCRRQLEGYLHRKGERAEHLGARNR